MIDHFEEKGSMRMFKFATALLGSAALLATPVAASAQHIYSPSGSTLVLAGPAYIATAKCYLTLNVTLTEMGGHISPPLYDGGTINSGTNMPNPDIVCLGIFITGGSFDLANYGISGAGTAEILISDLEINGVCHTGPLTGTVVTVVPPIELYVPPTNTPCGYIELILGSGSQNPVAIVQ